MKTKKLTLLIALLLSGIIVSAQSFSSDKVKMELATDQTSVPHHEISDNPLTPTDYIIFSSGLWNLVKQLYVVPGVYKNTNASYDAGVGISLKPKLGWKDRRILPPLPTNPHPRTLSGSDGYNTSR